MRKTITHLTPEQEALLPLYREKWLNAIDITQPIDREKAKSSINGVYQALGLPQPKILFFESPLGIVKEVLENKYPGKRAFERINNKFSRQLLNHVWQGIRNQLSYGLYTCSIYTIESLNIREDKQSDVSGSEFWMRVWEEIYHTLVNYQEELSSYQFSFLSSNIQQPLFSSYLMCEIDFCTSVLNCHYDRNKWKILDSFFRSFGFVLLGENVCLVSDRPRKISLDRAGHLHAEGEPAIEFADGFCVYLYHGIRVPEKYGSVSSQQWNSQWLLSEEDAELRQLMIQELGYEKLCQELPTIQLDRWQDLS